MGRDAKSTSWKIVTELVPAIGMTVASGLIVWAFLAKPVAQNRTAALAPPREPISLQGAELMGNASARAAILEYSDFQCPYCARFAETTLPRIIESYVKTGKIRFGFRHSPIASLHPLASRAAQAAECAGQQDDFWPMHDWLFANQKGLDEPKIEGSARAIGLRDPASFETCLAGPPSGQIRAGTDSATTLGLRGTPAFLVGRILEDGRLQVSTILSGARPFEDFEKALESIAPVAQPGQ